MSRTLIASVVGEFANRLATEATGIVEEFVERAMANAHAVALDQLRIALGSTVITPARPAVATPKQIVAPLPPVAKSPKRTKDPKARTYPANHPSVKAARREAIANAAVTSKGTKRERAVMKCGKCGAIGKRADSCGRTHNVKSTATTGESSDEDEGGVYALAIIDPVARFEALPPALIIDDDPVEESDEIDGGGAFPMLPVERPPLIELSPTDHREVCDVHGWIGRLAFQRDRHDLCLRTIEGVPCRRCDGRRFVTGKFCSRCNGTGIEPGEIEAEEDDDKPAALPALGPIAQPHLVHRRRQRRRSDRGVARGVTIAMKSITRAELAEGAALYPVVDVVRPKTRADCVDGERPCPFVGCRHHLYLDINGETGSIKLVFPTFEPWDLQHTCALDVADRGGITLEETGEILNITRERVRQIELIAFHVLKSDPKVVAVKGSP